MGFTPKNYVWIEKWRPKHVKDLVGSFKEKMLKYLENPESMPNFLFTSTVPGTGKTSLSRAIINDLDCDKLILNSSDERKLEVIRDKIKDFVMSKSSDGKRRCVMLDEADGMLKTSQEALRNIMETYSYNAFFILTANTTHKIIEPIRSRCIQISFTYPEKQEIYGYLENICKEEKLDYTEEGIHKLIEINYPSIRNCVVVLQDLWTEEKPVTIETVRPINQIYYDIWGLFKENKIKQIKEIVYSGGIDARELNTFFWEKSWGEEPYNTKLLQITAMNEAKIADGSNATIIFTTSLFDAIK